jgi:hypothetical protein
MKDRIYSSEDIEDSELEKLYCPKCKSVGLYIILGKKILLPQEVKQPDYDDWLQCGRCRFLCPIYEASPEDIIQDKVSTIENPFDNSSKITGVVKGSKSKRKRFKDKINPVVEKELEKGASDVHVTDLRD